MEVVEGKKTGSKVYKIGSELYTIEKRHRRSDTILYIKTSQCSKYLQKTFVKCMPQKHTNKMPQKHDYTFLGKSIFIKNRHNYGPIINDCCTITV